MISPITKTVRAVNKYKIIGSCDTNLAGNYL